MSLWNTVPSDRVVYLRGPSPEKVELVLEDADDTPVTFAYSISSLLAMPDVVESLLIELDRAARGLLGQWLPEAITTDTLTGDPAILRQAATQRSFTIGVPAAFLADLAERAVRGQAPLEGCFMAEVRAAGLAKTIVSAHERTGLAILLRANKPLRSAALEQVIGAAQWLAHHGNLGVWLVGSAWEAVDHVASVDLSLPVDIDVANEGMDAPPASYPTIRGVPRWNSTAEQALERALHGKTWADGRKWNEPYQSHPLANPITVDLLWRLERCVVEIDGPEHREVTRFEADRHRDVQLQLDGFAVLRFTNSQIDHDVGTVVSQLKHFLTTRRTS